VASIRFDPGLRYAIKAVCARRDSAGRNGANNQNAHIFLIDWPILPRTLRPYHHAIRSVYLFLATWSSDNSRFLASTEANSFGPEGDISPFTERLRLYILSDKIFIERVEADPL
jgi:hypothetical protein